MKHYEKVSDEYISSNGHWTIIDVGQGTVKVYRNKGDHSEPIEMDFVDVPKYVQQAYGRLQADRRV